MTAFQTSPDITLMCDQLISGDRRALSRAITLVESSNPEHRQKADTLLSALLPHCGNAIRIGITGTPGVGKSTFIEAFGQHLISQGIKLAVLAVDPSSPKSGGSILGDKTRMEKLSRLPDAFIRPSPSGGMLGGVARKTYETMLLCEASGFDVIIIETVGVGQSETMAASLVDVFTILLNPGGGDDLQGIKRGIMEMADLMVINKADGDLIPAAERAKRDYGAALHLMGQSNDDGSPSVLSCSARTHMGIDEVWSCLKTLYKHRKQSGKLLETRAQQTHDLLETDITQSILHAFRHNKDLKTHWEQFRHKINEGSCTPSAAAQELLSLYRQSD